MKALALILVFPRRAAGFLRLRPMWILPFLLLSVAAMGSMIAHHPLRVEETLRRLPPHLTTAERAAAAADLNSRLPARVLAYPGRLLLGWSTFALVLFVSCRAAAPEVPLRYVQVLALQIHCATAEIIGTWLLPVLRDAVPGPALYPGTVLGGPLLNSLNIFTLWYVVLLIGGVGVLCAARPLKATLLVFVAWGSSLAFHTAVFRLLRDALHLAL
jgi:hypothetical protein